MATKEDLEGWIVAELQILGGKAHHVRVAEAVWKRHESELRESGDLFYTWQYDLRWAKQELRNRGVLAGDVRPKGTWALTSAT